MQKHAFFKKIKKTFSLFTSTYSQNNKKVLSNPAETRKFSCNTEGQTECLHQIGVVDG